MQYIGTQIIDAEKGYKYIMPGGKNFIVADSVEVGEEERQVLHECVAAERGYKIRHANGHVSWCPSDVFEENYHPMEGMNFGLALEAAKQGKKISRAGWNGKGQYVFLADTVEFHTDADISELKGDIEVSDILVIRTTRGLQPGWLATQSDMLAEDWMIVEV